MLDAADRLREGLVTLGAARQPQQLAVGASQTIAAHLLPGWLVSLRRQQEAAGDDLTAVELCTANSTDVVGLVRSGSLDLGFIETPHLPADLGHRTIGSDPLVVAVAATHPWAARSAVTLAEVAATPLVTREAGSGTRAAYERAVADRLGVAVAAPAATLATEAAVRSAISHGVAPAVVSGLSVSDDIRLGRIVVVPLTDVPPFEAAYRDLARRRARPPRGETPARRGRGV